MEAIAIVSSMHELEKYVPSEDHLNPLHTVDEGDEDEDDDDDEDEDEDDDEHDDDETRTNEKKHAVWDRYHASVYKEHLRKVSEQQRCISAIRDLSWEHPDSAPANSKHIDTVSKTLESAFIQTGSAEQYDDVMFNFRHHVKLLQSEHKSQSDQQHMILNMSYILDNLKERFKTLDRKVDVQMIQTNALNKQDSYRDNEVQYINSNLRLAETNVRRLIRRMDALEAKLPDASIAKAPATRTKNWRFWANMSPEMQTLPDLLAQLQRPATP